MSVSDQMDALRAQLPGCALTAFGDVASQLILRSSAEPPWSQEKLDELCKTGARQLRVQSGLGFSDGPRQVIVATAQDIRVFVAAPEPAGDMVCCVCRSGVKTDHVLRHARAALDQLTDRDQ